MTTKPDLFDEMSDQIYSLFDDVNSTEEDSIKTIETNLDRLAEKIVARNQNTERSLSEIKELVKAEVAKIKPTQNIIERQIEQIVKHVQVPVHLEPRVYKLPAPPPQIIKETRIEVEKKDDKKYIEQSTFDELKKELDDLKKKHQDLLEALPMMHGGPGVIGIPPPEGNPDNYVLTKVAGRAKWAAAAAGGSVTPSGDTYTVSNLTPDFTYDAQDTSLDEIAAVLGSLIASCRTSGIVA